MRTGFSSTKAGRKDLENDWTRSSTTFVATASRIPLIQCNRIPGYHVAVQALSGLSVGIIRLQRLSGRSTYNCDAGLILVDAPLNLSAACVRRQQRRSPTLRFLYASNTGGLVLPQLLSEPTYSLFESLRTVFGYSWHLALLFYSPRNKYSKGGILPPHAFLYMCAASIWATNLRFLDRDIKRISFEDIRHPSLKVNDRLHDRREDLIRLKAALLETNRHVPPNLDEFLERSHILRTRPRPVGFRR